MVQKEQHIFFVTNHLTLSTLKHILNYRMIKLQDQIVSVFWFCHYSFSSISFVHLKTYSITLFIFLKNSFKSSSPPDKLFFANYDLVHNSGVYMLGLFLCILENFCTTTFRGGSSSVVELVACDPEIVGFIPASSCYMPLCPWAIPFTYIAYWWWPEGPN